MPQTRSKSLLCLLALLVCSCQFVESFHLRHAFLPSSQPTKKIGALPRNSMSIFSTNPSWNDQHLAHDASEIHEETAEELKESEEAARKRAHQRRFVSSTERPAAGVRRAVSEGGKDGGRRSPSPASCRLPVSSGRYLAVKDLPVIQATTRLPMPRGTSKILHVVQLSSIILSSTINHH